MMTKQINEYKMKENQMRKEIDELATRLRKSESDKELIQAKLRRSLLSKRSNRRPVCLQCCKQKFVEREI